MAGLERIIEKIKSDTAVQCRLIAEKAEKEIAELLANAEKAAEEKAAGIRESAEKEAGFIAERAVSGGKQKSGQALLLAKTKTIDEILSEALNRMNNLPDEEYFSALLSLAVKYSGDREEGVIFFNERDLKRLPDDFEAQLRDKGCNAKISKTPDNRIESGFVLAFGDVEENCTFGALLDEKRDVLKEKICEIIF